MSSGQTWLSTALREAAEALLSRESELADEPTPQAVHKARVASRRLRSQVRVFADLLTLDPQERDELDSALGDFARRLGALRDTDVQHTLAHRHLDALPAEHVMGPVRDEVDEALAERRERAVADWRESGHDDALLDQVERLVTAPLVPPQVSTKQASRLLRKARRKAEARSSEASDPGSRHRARRAVRRVRFAAEAATPSVKHAKRYAKQAKRTGRALGLERDLDALAGFARDQAARYGALEHHNGFAYGLLLAAAERERLMSVEASGTRPA